MGDYYLHEATSCEWPNPQAPKRADAPKRAYTPQASDNPRTIQVNPSLRAMHLVHGASLGHACGDCTRLFHSHTLKSHGIRVYMCRLFLASGRVTRKQWSMCWPACGRFQPRTDGGL
jgi:hypothetical protein